MINENENYSLYCTTELGRYSTAVGYYSVLLSICLSNTGTCKGTVVQKRTMNNATGLDTKEFNPFNNLLFPLQRWVQYCTVHAVVRYCYSAMTFSRCQMVVKGRHLAAMGLLLLRLPTRLAWITTLRYSYRTGFGRSERSLGFTVDRNCGRAGCALGTTLAVLGNSESRSVTASASGDEVQHADPARASGALSSNVQPILRKYIEALEAGAKRKT